MACGRALSLAPRRSRAQGLGHIVGQFDDFQSPRALLHPPQKPALFQGSDEPVYARF
jgi:hypothetical protein